MLAFNNDPFWIAKITNCGPDILEFTYFHYKLDAKNEQVWFEHDTIGSCKILDVLLKCKNETSLFTKKNKIRKNMYKKIAQAYSLYTGKNLN